MKRTKTSFVSPVKNSTNSNSSNNSNNNSSGSSNSSSNNSGNSLNKTPKKKSSSFQTPTKIVVSTPSTNNSNNKNNILTNTNNTTSTSTINNNISTPQGLNLTNVKEINCQLFTTIPKYILEFLNQFSQDSEKEQYSLVIDYCYLNWSNNPFSEYDLLDIYKDKLINLEKIKDIIFNLVTNNILKQISIKENFNIYSSIPWFKLINYVGLEIEIKRYEERQLELEKQKEKEKNQKQSKYNTVAPKNTLTSIVATLSPSKPKENHLSASASSSTKKRKSTATSKSAAPIPFNLNQDLDNDNNDPTSKRLKIKTSSIKSSKYELSIDRELVLISDEKKRLLKSIQEKKDALLKFQSKSNSPISEQKMTVPNQQEEKRVEGLIYKWKKASQDAITLLQEKVIDYMGKQAPISTDTYKYDERPVGNLKSSSGWNGDQDTDVNDEQYQKEFKYDYFEKEITATKDNKQPEVTSKLYIINQYGLNPKDLNYDEETDEFKKL